MIMLTGLLLRKGGPGHLERAGLFLEQLQKMLPDSSRIDLLHIRLEAARSNRHKFSELADDFVRTREFGFDAFVQIADISASLGHFARCRDIYQLVLERIEGPEKERLKIAFADQALLWGDYYTAEDIIREGLDFDAGNPELLLRLARNLIAQQRFVEARKYLKDIVRDAEQESQVALDAWTEKISLGLQEKDYARAARDTDQFLAMYNTLDQILIPGARAYYKAGRLADAKDLYAKARETDKLQDRARIGLGLIKISQKDHKGAARYLSAVDPGSEQYPLARVLYYQDDQKALSEYVQGVVHT